jgi:hypothetical protein
VVRLFDHHFDLCSQKHHDMIIFICIFITHFIIPGADVCIVESTFCFTMVGPSFVSFHKTTLY